MRSRDIKSIPVMGYRLFIAVGFFESPLVWDCIVAVIKDNWFSAIVRPTSLWPSPFVKLLVTGRFQRNPMSGLGGRVGFSRPQPAFKSWLNYGGRASRRL